MINPCTWLWDSMAHDTADVLVWAMLRFMDSGRPARQWKRDVKRAFARLPTWRGHRDLCGSVWQHEKVKWFSLYLVSLRHHECWAGLA